MFAPTSKWFIIPCEAEERQEQKGIQLTGGRQDLQRNAVEKIPIVKNIIRSAISMLVKEYGLNEQYFQFKEN